MQRSKDLAYLLEDEITAENFVGVAFRYSSFYLCLFFIAWGVSQLRAWMESAISLCTVGGWAFCPIGKGRVWQRLGVNPKKDARNQTPGASRAAKEKGDLRGSPEIVQALGPFQRD